jgi:hypothetical protein
VSSTTHASLIEVRSMITQMLGNAGDEVRMVDQLAKRVRELPPADAALKSRPRFDRSGLQSYCANFFRLPEDLELTKQIRIAHDCWVRGVTVSVLPALAWEEEPPTAAAWFQAAHMRALVNRYGSNWRALVDIRWRIEDDQGFIQDGYAAVAAPATQVAGDGEAPAALDWTLKRDQHIVVNVTNRINRTIDPVCATAFVRELPWVAVNFWAERDE